MMKSIMHPCRHTVHPTLLLPVLLAFSLGGCGGGGGGGSAISSGPSLPASVAPATSVLTPTYAAGDARLAIFNSLNSFRAALGVGMLAQNADLDTAATAHANYLDLNRTETHDEVNGNPGFYADTPRDRATLSGVGASVWVGEVIGDANTCVDQLLDSVYHLEALTSSAEQVGIGIGGTWVCVLDGATVTGTGGTTPQANAIPLWGGQQMADTAVALSPYSGEAGVDTAMTLGENPRAVPLYSNPGHPVMVRVRADGGDDNLTVTGFSLSASNGSPLPGSILVAANAVNGSTAAVVADSNVVNGVVFFVPENPLASSTTYTAVFSGARDGKAVAETWSFTTQ